MDVGRVFRPRFRTLTGHLTLVLFLVSSTASTLTAYLFLRSFLHFSDEIDQRMHLEAASALAPEFKPFEVRDIHPAQSLEIMRRVSERYPNYDLFILNSSGEVELHSPLIYPLKRKSVSLTPLDAWFSENGEDKLGLRIDVPNSTRRTSPFSAARIVFDGAPAYLLVIIKGERFYYTASVFGETQVYIFLAELLLTLVLFFTAIGFVLIRFAVRRLSNMTEVISRYAEGNSSLRIEDQSQDELGFHARTFNSMADRIEQSVGALKRSEEMRRDLVANISHDLRTPVAAAQGLVESVMQNYAGQSDSDRMSLLRSAKGSLTQLGSLIGDLFELSKLDASEKKPQFDSFSAGELVQDVTAKMLPLAAAKNISLSAQLAPDAAMVQGDIAMIERVLTNLIDNAVKYTMPGGSVRVCLTSTNGQYRIDVIDSGKGISEADIPFLFQRFHRARNSKSDDGAGLGLAIAQRMVALHGSNLEVESTVNQGSRFSFLLPSVSPGS